MRLAVLADVHDNLPALEAVVRDIQKLNVDGVIAAGDYALLTWEDGRWQVEHRAVAYDVTQVRQAFRNRGFLAEGGAFARAYLLSIETGRNVVGHLFSHIDRLALEAGAEGWDVVPEAIWDHAVTTFRWAEYISESRRG